MKMHKIIAIGFLALYSLVLAHNFVPHHHHSLTEAVVQQCNHGEDHHHQSKSGNIKLEHNHKNEKHIHCSFEEVIVLRGKINLSELYLCTVSSEVYLPEEEGQTLADNYILPLIPEPHCRDVQLRGPPHFS